MKIRTDKGHVNIASDDRVCELIVATNGDPINGVDPNETAIALTATEAYMLAGAIIAAAEQLQSRRCGR